MADESTHQWQIDVSGKLGALIAQVADLTAQVSRQNGNVARLQTEKDAENSALEKRVTALELTHAAMQASIAAADKATAPWRRWTERIAFSIGGVFFILVLLNAASILKMFHAE